MRVTVVIPATNAPSTLARCLAAIEVSTLQPDEVIVVDAPAGAGPAAARNAGLGQTTSEIVVFVDSDVVVAPDALSRIRRHFEDDPELVAVFGSYDDTVATGDVVSGFRNLLHHVIHHRHPGLAQTFWAGLGAVRRAGGARGQVGSTRRATAFLRSRTSSSAAASLASGRAPRPDDPGNAPEAMEPVVDGRDRLLTARRPVGGADGGASHDAGDAQHRPSRAHQRAQRPGRGRSALAADARSSPVPRSGARSALNLDLYAVCFKRLGVRGAAAACGLHTLHQLTAAAAVPVGLARHAQRARRAPDESAPPHVPPATS